MLPDDQLGAKLSAKCRECIQVKAEHLAKILIKEDVPKRLLQALLDRLLLGGFEVDKLDDAKAVDGKGLQDVISVVRARGALAFAEVDKLDDAKAGDGKGLQDMISVVRARGADL